MSRILIVERDPEVVGRLLEPLVDAGCVAFAALDADEAERVFRQQVLDVVLVSLGLGETSGLDLIERFRGWDPTVETVLLTDADSARVAVRAVKLGAVDVVPRTATPALLRRAVEQAVRSRVARRQLDELQRREVSGRIETVPARSPMMAEVERLAGRAAASDVGVLITGESGAGKEMVARQIVAAGPRASRPLVTIDCGALPESLIESELFGHEKGAFTGAASRKPGRLEVAEGGTVLLDEIGNLPLPMQPRLLRVLESGEVQRIGGTRPVRVDVRFIALTNADLVAAVRSGALRGDLFHRLNVFPLHVPPLRERRDDIAPLVDHFLGFFGRKHRKQLAPPTDAARALLVAYDWPGNIRELRNVIERAVILADERISPESLPGLGEPAIRAGRAGPEGRPLEPLKQAKERAAREAAERSIGRALEQTGGDKKAAARLLGVSLKTLYNHLAE